MMRRTRKTRKIMLMISLTISCGTKTWKIWRKKSRRSKKKTRMRKTEKSTLEKETSHLKTRLTIKSKMLRKETSTTKSMILVKRTRKSQKTKRCLMPKVKVENVMKARLRETRKVNKKMSLLIKTL